MNTAEINAPRMSDPVKFLKESRTVEKVKGITQEQMIERYMFPRKPVVLQDATKNWQALSRWSPEFWMSEYGAKIVKVDAQEYPLKEIIQLALDSTEENPAPYFRNVEIESVFPEILKDIEPVPETSQPNWLYSPLVKPLGVATRKFGIYHELFIGGAGKCFPYMHYDDPGTNTFIHQLWGRKLFILFPPDDGPYLYPGTGEGFRISRIKDVLRVNLDEFPNFPKATQYTVELGPGESVFIPCGWWHTTKMTSFSISVSEDILNHANWEFFMNYQRRKVSHRNKIGGAAFLAYLNLMGACLKMTAPRRNPNA